MTHLELAKVALRLDQPSLALQIYEKAVLLFPTDTALMIGIARVHDALGNGAAANLQYKKVLAHDASNIEAIACMAATHFYSDQPELALRFYRRLLQMGARRADIDPSRER